MSNDLPAYETLYGIYADHATWTYGHATETFNASHYMLTKEYLDEGCITTDYSSCPTGVGHFLFLYPHWIKKQYYIEGVVEGQFCLSCSSATDTLIYYQVDLKSVDASDNIRTIGTTGPIVLNYTLNWNAGLGIGDEVVIPFFMTITPEQKMIDGERLYIDIIVDATTNHLILYHSNDATWQDIKIQIPFRGL